MCAGGRCMLEVDVCRRCMRAGGAVHACWRCMCVLALLSDDKRQGHEHCKELLLPSVCRAVDHACQ